MREQLRVHGVVEEIDRQGAWKVSFTQVDFPVPRGPSKKKLWLWGATRERGNMGATIS